MHNCSLFYFKCFNLFFLCLGHQATVSPIGPDELPPPFYQASAAGGVPMVTCRVCQAMIDISGKRDQHVVKCCQCNEATVGNMRSCKINIHTGMAFIVNEMTVPW